MDFCKHINYFQFFYDFLVKKCYHLRLQFWKKGWLMNDLVAIYQRFGLIRLILVGLIVGTLIGWLLPDAGVALGLLGTLFVGALKAVAPILIFVLVMAAICQHRTGSEVYVKPVLFGWNISGSTDSSLSKLCVSC